MRGILRAILSRPAVKLPLVVLAVACAVPFVLHDRAGRPLMSLERLSAPALALPDLSAAEAAYRRVRSALPAPPRDGGATVVYRWRDEQGVWQFSDHNRPDGTGEAIAVDGGANLVHFEEPALAAPPVPAAATAEPASPFALSGAPRLIRETRQVEETLHRRHERQREALGD